MIDRTSTEYAPWTLVAASDKRHARLEVLRTLVLRLEREVG
jgi:polyphosphate kinase 2 (PPK2 family)